MRDKPLVLLVPWGKSDKRFWPSQNLDIKKGRARAEKKEEPRGNGARNSGKT
jgi:hypothetical protein